MASKYRVLFSLGSFEICTGQAVGVFRDVDRSRVCHAFHPRPEIGGVPDSGGSLPSGCENTHP